MPDVKFVRLTSASTYAATTQVDAHDASQSRVMSAGIAGAARAPHGRERTGAALAIATAVPLAYLTLAGRKRAMARMGQTRSGLLEDAFIVAAGVAVVALATR